jgi:hypothetical protein
MYLTAETRTEWRQIIHRKGAKDRKNKIIAWGPDYLIFHHSGAGHNPVAATKNGDDPDAAHSAPYDL